MNTCFNSQCDLLGVGECAVYNRTGKLFKNPYPEVYSGDKNRSVGGVHSGRDSGSTERDEWDWINQLSSPIGKHIYPSGLYNHYIISFVVVVV